MLASARLLNSPRSLWVCGITQPMDMKVAAGPQRIDFGNAPLAGKSFMFNTARFWVPARTGTATGTYGYTVGANASAYDNMQIITGAAVGNFNTAAPGFSFTAAGTPTQFPVVPVDGGIFFNLTAPVGGVTALTALFAFFGWLVDTP